MFLYLHIHAFLCVCVCLSGSNGTVETVSRCPLALGPALIFTERKRVGEENMGGGRKTRSIEEEEEEEDECADHIEVVNCGENKGIAEMDTRD